MFKYQLSNQDKLDVVLSNLEDYLLEKERWLVVRDFSDVNYANQCSALREQVGWIQGKVHNRNETLNHYLGRYKQLSIEQLLFLLSGLNPHSLDNEAFKAFRINDLQIGTGASHNTTIEGTLTVQTPTADGHATTKGYVDTLTSANTTNITGNTSNISTNTTSITSEATTARAAEQANATNITSNASDIAAHYSSFTSSINSNTSSINSNTSNITINTNDIKNLSTGLAQSMAMASLATPAQGRSSFSIGTGYYDGQSALAVGFAHQNKSGNGLIRIMGASASGVNSGAASFSWGF